MIFRFAALLLLSLSSLQSTSAIEVSMINMDDVSENHRVVSDAFNPYGDSSYVRGVSMIKSGLKKLLVKTANQDMDVSSMDPQEWHEVQTTFLTSTSKYHQDHKHDETRTLVEDEVGFVALNTNEDAYFDHPDMKVPIREGAFIRFNGSDPHRTIVNKGSVHLLGPFDLKSFGKEGFSTYCCGVITEELIGTAEWTAAESIGVATMDIVLGPSCFRRSFNGCFGNQGTDGYALFPDLNSCNENCDIVAIGPEPCVGAKKGKKGKAGKATLPPPPPP